MQLRRGVFFLVASYFHCSHGLVRHVCDHLQTHNTHKGEYEVTGKFYGLRVVPGRRGTGINMQNEH